MFGLFANWRGGNKKLPVFSILIIDDNPVDVTAVQKALEKKGQRVAAAPNGEEGIGMAKTLRPDVILLDCILPGIGGIDVCRRLKADPATRSIPVIFLTSVEDGYNLLQCYDVGANTCLRKPIGARELLSEIQIAVSEKEPEEEIPPSSPLFS